MPRPSGAQPARTDDQLAHARRKALAYHPAAADRPPAPKAPGALADRGTARGPADTVPPACATHGAAVRPVLRRPDPYNCPGHPVEPVCTG
jgi:hypothetical protein